jgi:hypothetical protein
MIGQSKKEWDSITGVTRRTPYDLYQLTVKYKPTSRQDTFVCRAKSECYLLAEVCIRSDEGETAYTVECSDLITLWTEETSGTTSCYKRKD